MSRLANPVPVSLSTIHPNMWFAPDYQMVSFGAFRVVLFLLPLTGCL